MAANAISCVPTPLIALSHGKTTGAVRKFRLSASRARLNLGAGLDFWTWTYIGQGPGPEIEYDFNKILEGMLSVINALVPGYLTQKERRKHRELMQSENLAAMGKSLSEIAHDMKTPLVAIGGFSGQVIKNLGTHDMNRRKLHIVLQETVRLRKWSKECSISVDLFNLKNQKQDFL